ncbi:GNAT family N-acetyltransferase [Dictyobacter aurantiacus]|uniref:N-acetyltransferase n=1 Tax=Dictyobacter aurantiacus TaxID=1936993 RepID=A0A401ZPK5_9CHLR|nr:GNAT family N-acetyltransferase [Dictyobacter aurantiacus]GCE08791.1 N-acetyltransferase [Dictyobacter aurantiacus]
MRKATLPLITDYAFRYLTLADTDNVQDLYERCADYVELVTGHKPESVAAQRIFTEIPTGKTYNDKLLIGIFTPDNKLIGIIDAIRDYPTTQEWYLNLLLLDPQERHRGLGEKIYHVFAGWAATQGAQTISLTVLTQNTQALRFWQRLGFEASEYTDDGAQRTALRRRI